MGKIRQLSPYPGAGKDWQVLAGQLRGCKRTSWEGERSRDLDYLNFKEFVF